MKRILRTIAIISIAFNAVMFGVGWLFGMTPTQSLGAGVIGFAAIGLVLSWRAVVNAPQEHRRQNRSLGCDPVAPPLVAPGKPRITIEAPERKLIEAPRSEVEVSHER